MAMGLPGFRPPLQVNDKRGLVAAGLEFLDGKAAVIDMRRGVDFGQRMRQPRVVDAGRGPTGR